MQRYFSTNKVDNTFILNEEDLYHIQTVMRMTSGDEIEVVFAGRVYECCIVSVNQKMKFLIKKEIEISQNKRPHIALIIPLVKEIKLDLILQKATEIGVNEILITPMERCIVKLEGNKKENKMKRWQRIVKEASEQSKRIDIPQIKLLDSLQSLPNLSGLKLICSTNEKQKNLKRVLTKNKNCDRINLVIGPEGGLASKEEEFLQQVGYEKITLGNQILRVETVPLFLASVIAYEYME